MRRQIKNQNLGIAELPTGSAQTSEPPGPEVKGNTSDSGVIEVPTNSKKVKWTPKQNRLLWKCYKESLGNGRGYMARMHEAWINHGGFAATKQQLRTQIQNIVKQNLLTDVERGEIEAYVKAEENAAILNRFSCYNLDAKVVLEELKVD